MAIADSAMLDLVDAALEALMTGGQSYSRAGLTFTRADLGRLWTMRKELRASVAEAGANGIAFVSDNSGSTSGETSDWG